MSANEQSVRLLILRPNGTEELRNCIRAKLTEKSTQLEVHHGVNCIDIIEGPVEVLALSDTNGKCYHRWHVQDPDEIKSRKLTLD